MLSTASFVRHFRYLKKYRQDVKTPFPPRDRSKLFKLDNGRKLCYVTDGEIVTDGATTGKIGKGETRAHTPVLSIIKGGSHHLACNLTWDETKELMKLAPQIEKYFKDVGQKKAAQEQASLENRRRYALDWDSVNISTSK